MQLDSIRPTAGHHTAAAPESPSGPRQGAQPRSRSQESAEDAGAQEIQQDRLDRQTPSAEELREVVEELSKYTGWGNFDISFSRDDKTDSLVVTLTERDSGEMIRQFPPEEILSLRSHIQHVLGLVFDHMA